MSKVSVNTFEGGMNKDLSKVVHTKNTATDIYNFRPITDELGKATGGLVNIEGNALAFTFPKTMGVFRFETNFTSPFPVTVDMEIEVGGVTHTETLSVSGIDNSTYRDSLVEAINNNVDFNSLGVVAYESEEDAIVITTTTVANTFNVTLLSPELINLTTLVPEQTGVQIIGWADLRDDLILFTTNDDTSVGGSGQIWRVNIDPITRGATLTLIYNNLLNFTILHPIEAVARYETSNIEKVYWTDNFNKVRYLNIGDPNAFGTPIENVDLQPIVNHDVPVLEKIKTGGTLDTGIYQFAYRLRSLSGGETSFSRLSRIIPINFYGEEDTNYWEYVGEDSELNTGKAIEMSINNIDIDYDFIEVVALYRSNDFNEPTITSLFTENIPANGSLTFTHTGSEQNTVEISTDEFLVSTSVFTHAKTLTIKDNRLFAGNVKNEFLDIGDYDTRAYGFDSGGNFSVDGIIRTSAQFGDVEETDNAINDDYDTYKFKDGTTLYGGTGPNISYEIKTRQIQADQKGLTTDGSEYEALPFRTVFTNTTSDIDLGEGRTYPQSATFPDGMRNPHMFDLFRGYMRDEIYRFAIVFIDKQGNPGFANWIADVKIPPVFDSNRAGYGTDGYINGSFDGRTIRETGASSPGSIDYSLNIPYIEFDVTLTQDLKDKISGYSIVRVERTDDDKTIVGQGLALPIGPILEVDDPESPNVRSVINDMEAGEKYMFPTVNRRNHNASGFTLIDSAGITPAVNALASESRDVSYLTVQFPDHLLTNSINFRTGDQLKTVDVLGCDNSTVTDSNNTFPYTPSTVASSNLLDDNFRVAPAASASDEYQINIRKFYKESSGSNPYGAAPIFDDGKGNEVRDIAEFYKVPRAGIVSLPNDIEFRNETSQLFRESVHKPINGGYGEKTILMKLENAGVPAGIHTFVGSGGLNGATHLYNAYIVNYYRNLTSQYGGNTYAQRSNNVYIGASNFVRIDDDSSLNTVFDVFGGDISMGVFDVQRYIKIWDNDLSLDPEHSKLSQAFAFPVESTINVDLRSDKYTFANGLTDDGSNSTTDPNNEDLTGTVDLGEDFNYNKVYSVNDNIVSYFAKPLEFILTDEFDNRIYASDPKINGESTDSWSIFRVNEYIDLGGEHGPINKLEVLNNDMLSFQDSAVAVVAVNPRAVVQGSDGINLELGTGNVLYDYTNVSTSIGCKHQWGVLKSKTALYWPDINTNKIYRFGGRGVEPLSDIKGLFSFLRNELKWEVRSSYKEGGDNPLIGKGITGYYDEENNELIFTFVGTKITNILNLGSSYQVGDLVVTGNDVYEVHTDFTAGSIGDLKANANIIFNGFTIAFNEFSDSYSSFYDQQSVIYPYVGRHIMSPDHLDRVSIYQHNIGDRCSFYGTIYDSTVKYITNEAPLNTKVFDNTLWHTEVTDISGNNLNDTFYLARYNTDYQNSGDINLTVNDNLKRRERTWRMAVPRSTTNRERLRDKYMEVELLYDNSSNNRMVLHYIMNSFRGSAR